MEDSFLLSSEVAAKNQKHPTSQLSLSAGLNMFHDAAK
jgi:hypothetical protein